MDEGQTDSNQHICDPSGRQPKISDGRRLVFDNVAVTFESQQNQHSVHGLFAAINTHLFELLLLTLHSRVWKFWGPKVPGTKSSAEILAPGN